MCETLGTNWEDTAKQQISLKLEAWEAIARVRELHQPCICVDGKCGRCDSCDFEYPCPTIKALDGEQ